MGYRPCIDVGGTDAKTVPVPTAGSPCIAKPKTSSGVFGRTHTLAAVSHAINKRSRAPGGRSESRTTHDRLQSFYNPVKYYALLTPR